MIVLTLAVLALMTAAIVRQRQASPTPGRVQPSRSEQVRTALFEEIQPVKVSRQEGPLTVIASGISAGDEVVTDGQLRLTPGARITEKSAPASAAGTDEGATR